MQIDSFVGVYAFYLYAIIMIVIIWIFTFEFPESFQRIVPCFYGDDVVHPPSGTKFDYEFGKKTRVFATNLLATFNRRSTSLFHFIAYAV